MPRRGNRGKKKEKSHEIGTSCRRGDRPGPPKIERGNASNVRRGENWGEGLISSEEFKKPFGNGRGDVMGGKKGGGGRKFQKRFWECGGERAIGENEKHRK